MSSKPKFKVGDALMESPDSIDSIDSMTVIGVDEEGNGRPYYTFRMNNGGTITLSENCLMRFPKEATDAGQ